MLHAFLTAHRTEILSRARAKVRSRAAPRPTDLEVEQGIPSFLDQLVDTLRHSKRSSATIGPSAAVHANHLFRMGFGVAQIVHDYGDLCQAITELADELQLPISADEFQTLNRCLDDAIAEAVT